MASPTTPNPPQPGAASGPEVTPQPGGASGPEVTPQPGGASGPEVTPQPGGASGPEVTPEAEVERELALDRGPRRRIVQVLLVLGAALLLLALALALHRAYASDPVTYTTRPVTRGPLEVSVIASGTLEPRNLVEVGSELSGLVSRVTVEVNDAVTREQVLAELDMEQYRAQVEQAQAELALARAELTQARATRDEARQQRARAEALSPRALAAQEREAAVAAALRAEAAVQVARAGIRRAQAVLDVARSNLRRGVIRSPIDGIVLERTVETGQTVVASLEAPVLFRLAESLEQMTLRAEVDEADIGQVQEGHRVLFTVAAYLGREFEARVSKVHRAGRMLERVVVYETEIEVDNPERLLRPGMTATARIITRREEDALLVPNDALRFAPPGVEPPQRLPGVAPDGVVRGQVWVLEDDQPVAVTVTVGPSDDTHTMIGEGELAPGTPVLVGTR